MPSFVIGIGSQRAGSSLLHKILNECTSVFMHPVKELHYYDTLFDIRHEVFLQDYSKRTLEGEKGHDISEKNLIHGKKRYECYIRTNKLLASESVNQLKYLDLYRPCIIGNTYLGEITPEYMILPEAGIQKIKHDLGAETKIILLARNPVERLISAVKLLKVYNNEKTALADFAKDFHEILCQNDEWLQAQHKLSNYQSAMINYQKYFPNTLLLSYDQLFLKAEYTASRLRDFLGVPVNLAKFTAIIKSKVNNIADSGEIFPHDRRYLEIYYANEIKYLEVFFGLGECVR